VSAHSQGTAAHRRGTVARAREAALVGRLAELGTALADEPDPAFREATRARLVAMASVRTPDPTAKTRARRWLRATVGTSTAARGRSRLTAGLAGAAVAVTALAGLVAVSSSAQPGDPLYGLKRGTEQTQLALASDSSRGQTLLDFATTRLDELDRLLSGGPSALPAAGGGHGGGGPAVLAADAFPELVVQTLHTMDAQTTDGTAWLTTRAQQTGTTAPLDRLTGWAARQSAGLSALVPETPEGALAAMDDSLALLADVAGRGTALRDAITCPAGPTTTGSDRYGPVPGACGEQVPPPTASGGATPTPGTAPLPEQSASGLPVTSTAAEPTAGGGTGSGSGSGRGSGSSTGAATQPQASTPSTRPPGLPLPPLTAPGASSASSAGAPSSSSPPPSTGPPLISICLGPIVVGSC